MKSWGFPWFPFVPELLHEAAAKSPSPPLAKGGYRGVPMARQHGTRQPAPGLRDGDDHRRGAWSDKASGTGRRRWLRSQFLSQAAQERQIVARRRQPQVASMGQSDPLPRTPAGKGASVGRGLVSTRRGSEESGTNAPFWPGVCATRLQHAAPFESWLQGPGVNLKGPRRCSRGRRLPRRMKLAVPGLLFALIRNGLARGQYYHRARRENRKPARIPRTRHQFSP